MLLEMYEGLSRKLNWKWKCIASQEEGSGIRSATLRVDGDDVAPYLSCESGIHRLVRISPFDKNSRRHTSFASVIVSPLTDRSNSISIQPKDLNVDRYRAWRAACEQDGERGPIDARADWNCCGS